jgi:DNA mismatch endonuclease (patch repair protein)
MADVKTPAQRSFNMARIRRSNTKPELLLGEYLRAAGLRYKAQARLPGRPDVVFTKARVAIFVDGCFWHGCQRHLKWPKSNAHFWRKKILSNVARDKSVRATLRKEGWRVVRLWEHELRTKPKRCLARIQKVLAERKSRKPSEKRFV